MAIEPKGNRGNWFAEWRNEHLPVLWERQFHVRPTPTIKTDWVENGRTHTANKREEIKKYYCGRSTARVILASERKAKPMHQDGIREAPEVKKYIAIFDVEVLATEPEIELKVMRRLQSF